MLDFDGYFDFMAGLEAGATGAGSMQPDGAHHKLSSRHRHRHHQPHAHHERSRRSSSDDVDDTRDAFERHGQRDGTSSGSTKASKHGHSSSPKGSTHERAGFELEADAGSDGYVDGSGGGAERSVVVRLRRAERWWAVPPKLVCVPSCPLNLLSEEVLSDGEADPAAQPPVQSRLPCAGMTRGPGLLPGAASQRPAHRVVDLSRLHGSTSVPAGAAAACGDAAHGHGSGRCAAPEMEEIEEEDAYELDLDLSMPEACMAGAGAEPQQHACGSPYGAAVPADGRGASPLSSPYDPDTYTTGDSPDAEEASASGDPDGMAMSPVHIPASPVPGSPGSLQPLACMLHGVDALVAASDAINAGAWPGHSMPTDRAATGGDVVMGGDGHGDDADDEDDDGAIGVPAMDAAGSPIRIPASPCRLTHRSPPHAPSPSLRTGGKCGSAGVPGSLSALLPDCGAVCMAGLRVHDGEPAPHAALLLQ